MDIKQTMLEHHFMMVDKGYHDNELQIGTLLMLVVSECSEAMEAHRKGNINTPIHGKIAKFCLRISKNKFDDAVSDSSFAPFYENEIKHTFEDEIADIVLRVFDLAEKMNIDLEYQIKLKMAYNKLSIKKKEY